MTIAKSTKSKKPAKPNGSPLTPASNGQWIKKIKGRVYSFGVWSNHSAALSLYGQGFSVPSKDEFRKARSTASLKQYDAKEIHALIAAAHVNVKAMLWLGINCGFNNSDCRNFRMSVLDFKTGWLEFPRAKNHIPRRVKLWKETQAALRAALAIRPEPKDPNTPIWFSSRSIGNRGDNSHCLTNSASSKKS